MVDALEAQASGAIDRKLITGYIQAAASSWSESFALATVRASDPVRRALSPIILSQLGRDQILHGGSFLRLDMMAGDIHLQRPLSVYRLAGGGWQLTVGDPSRPSTVNVLDDEVLFMPWQTDAANPYKPVAPWRNATGSLGNELEAALIAESSGPMGSVLFVANPGPNPDFDAQKKTMESIAPNLDFTGSKRGRLAKMMYQGVGGKGFSQDHQGKPFRVGAAPPQGLVDLRSQLGSEILSSCSIPPAMLMGGSPGPAMITARRHFERTIIPARFKVISEYLSESFGERIMLAYPVGLRGDNSTSARTVAALTRAEVPLDEAMEIAGLR